MAIGENGGFLARVRTVSRAVAFRTMPGASRFQLLPPKNYSRFFAVLGASVPSEVEWCWVVLVEAIADQKNGKGLLARTIIFAIGLCASCGPAFSQSAPTPPPRAIFYSNIEPLTETIAREQRDPRPTTAGNALRALDWLIYGNVTVGGAYDSNVFGSPNQRSVSGARFQPYVIAERNTGIQRTLLYGTGDLRYYPSLGRTDVVSTTAGVTHVWEIQRDLVFRVQGEATRGIEASNLNSVLSAPGVTYTEPANYTSLFGSTSIEKSFGNFFTAMGASVTGTTYNNTKDNLGNVVSEQYRNGTMSTLNGRIGYHITPIVYAFVEPSMNWGRYNASNLDSDGYRIIGGLGTERISLFNGEIYAGTLTEHFTDPTIPTLVRGIYGGRVSWFPTRFISVTGAVDQSLGTSDFSPGLFTSGSVTKINTSKLSASWSVARDWNLDGRLAFKQYEFLNSTRRDDSTETGLAVTYNLNPRFGIVIDFSHLQYTSSLAGAGYTRNFVSVGGKTKF